MVKSVNIGICGLGTVGGGTFNVLARNHAQIAARTGCDIRVSHVAIRQAKSGDFGSLGGAAKL